MQARKLKALLVLINEGMIYKDEPMFKRMFDELKKAEISGTSVFKGIMGFGRHGGFIASDPFHGHGDAPISILIIDSEEKIQKAIKIVRSICEEAFMVMWDVEEPPSG